MFFYNNYVLIWKINEFFNLIVGYIKYDAILQRDQKPIKTMFVSFINLAKILFMDIKWGVRGSMNSKWQLYLSQNVPVSWNTGPGNQVSKEHN